MTATVFLVRHASHDLLGRVLCGRMAGVPLSEQGREEARLVGLRLRRERASALYASPVQRAVETATILSEALGLPLAVEPAIEEIDYGAWTGARFEDLEADPLWARWNTARSRCRPPDGEGAGDLQLRVAGWLDAVRARHAGQTVVAVTHGDVVKAALAHALGLSLDRHDRFEVSPASLSVLAAGDWGLKVHSLNEVQA